MCINLPNKAIPIWNPFVNKSKSNITYSILRHSLQRRIRSNSNINLFFLFGILRCNHNGSYKLAWCVYYKVIWYKWNKTKRKAGCSKGMGTHKVWFREQTWFRLVTNNVSLSLSFLLPWAVYCPFPFLPLSLSRSAFFSHSPFTFSKASSYLIQSGKSGRESEWQRFASENNDSLREKRFFLSSPSTSHRQCKSTSVLIRYKRE